MEGIILIDKPNGWTSFDVVNYIRKMVASHEQKKPKQVKVGHIGTLDPGATGLLVILIGSYTKFAPRLVKLDKTYSVTMRLGQVSSTGDSEGEISNISDIKPSLDEVKHVLNRFTGVIDQIPPAYSAIKVNGQRAYQLARAGQIVKLEPRQVNIYDNQLREYNYPVVEFTSKVSSGTYIRSLVEDIGKMLNTGAYMTDLRRTAVGQFNLVDAHQIKDKNLLDYIAKSIIE